MEIYHKEPVVQLGALREILLWVHYLLKVGLLLVSLITVEFLISYKYPLERTSVEKKSISMLYVVHQ